MSSEQVLCAGACDSSRGVGQIIAAGGIFIDGSKRTRARRKPNEPACGGNQTNPRAADTNEPEQDDKPNESKCRQKPNEPDKSLIVSRLTVPMHEQLASSSPVPGTPAGSMRPQPSWARTARSALLR